VLLSRGRAPGRDKDRDKGRGNLFHSMDNYNLHKNTGTGNWKSSRRDTDMSTDKGNSNPLDTDRGRDKCKSLHTEYNSPVCYKASDTGMNKDIRNPGQRCRRCTAS
jgi:hypothetical protein